MFSRLTEEVGHRELRTALPFQPLDSEHLALPDCRKGPEGVQC